jgi:hypothetical protein
VTQLERDWLVADGKGDVAALRRIIADDFHGGCLDGHVLSKEDIIPQASGPGGFAGRHRQKPVCAFLEIRAF